MTYERKYNSLVEKVIAWDGARKISEDLSCIRGVTDEELEKFGFTRGERSKFFENLENCQKSADERKAGDKMSALKAMSRNAVVYKKSLYVFDKRENHYITGTKALDKLVYDAFKTTKCTSGARIRIS